MQNSDWWQALDPPSTRIYEQTYLVNFYLAISNSLTSRATSPSFIVVPVIATNREFLTNIRSILTDFISKEVVMVSTSAVLTFSWSWGYSPSSPSITLNGSGCICTWFMKSLILPWFAITHLSTSLALKFVSLNSSGCEVCLILISSALPLSNFKKIYFVSCALMFYSGSMWMLSWR